MPPQAGILRAVLQDGPSSGHLPQPSEFEQNPASSSVSSRMSSITDDEAMDVSQDSGPLEQTSESSLQSSEINSTIYIGRMDTSQDTKGPKTTSEISRESIEIKSIVESETTEILEEAPSFGYMNVMLQREDTGHGIETYMKEISLPIAATWSEIASILRRHAPTVDKHGKITGQGFGKWMHVLVCNDIETVVEDSACVLDSDEAYEKFVEKLQDSDIKTAIVVRVRMFSNVLPLEDS